MIKVEIKFVDPKREPQYFDADDTMEVSQQDRLVSWIVGGERRTYPINVIFSVTEKFPEEEE